MKKSYKLIFIILFLFFTFQTVFSEEEDYCRIEMIGGEYGGNVARSDSEVKFIVKLKATELVKREIERLKSSGVGKNSLLYIASGALAVTAGIGGVIVGLMGGPVGVAILLVGGGIISGLFHEAIGSGTDIDLKRVYIQFVMSEERTGGKWNIIEDRTIKEEEVSPHEVKKGIVKEFTYKVPDFKSLHLLKVVIVFEFGDPFSTYSTLEYCGKKFIILPKQLPKIKIKLFDEDVTNGKVVYRLTSDNECILVEPSPLKGKVLEVSEVFIDPWNSVRVCKAPIKIELGDLPSKEDVEKEGGLTWNMVINAEQTYIVYYIPTVERIDLISYGGNGKKIYLKRISSGEYLLDFFKLGATYSVELTSGFESFVQKVYVSFMPEEVDLSKCKRDSNLVVYGSVPVPIELGIEPQKIEKDKLRVPTGTPVFLDLYDKSSGKKVSEVYKGAIYFFDERTKTQIFTPLQEYGEKSRDVVGVYLNEKSGELLCSPPLTITWTDKIEIELSHANIDLTQAKEVEVIATVASLDVVYSLNEKFTNGFYLTFVWNDIEIPTCTFRKGLNSFSTTLKLPEVYSQDEFNTQGKGKLSFTIKRTPSSKPLGISTSIEVSPTEIISKDGSRIYSIELSGCKYKFENYCYLRYCPPKLFVPTDMKENELRLQAISRLGDIVDSGQENAKLEVATGVSVEFNIFYCDPTKDKPVTETYVETEKCRIIINPKKAEVLEIREGGGGMSLTVKEVRETREVTKNFFAKLGDIESNTITISWKKPKLTMSPDPSTKPEIILAPGESATITVSSDIPVFSNFLDAYCKPFFPDLFQTIGLKNCENKAGSVIFGIDKDLDSERLLREIASAMDNLYYEGRLSWFCSAWKELLSTVRENMKKYVLPFCYDITSNSFSVTFSRGEEDKECWGEVELIATYTGGEFISYTGGESKENTPLKIKVTPFICKGDLGKEWYTLNCFGGRIEKGSEKGGGGGEDGGKSYIIKSLEFKDQGINAFSLPFKPEKVEFNENCRIERIQSEKIRNKNCKLDIVYYNPTTGWECVDLSKGFEPLIGYFVNISFVGSSKCKVDFAYTEPQNVPDIPDFSFTKDVKVYFFGVGKEVDSANIKREISQKIGKNVEIVKCGKYDFSSDNICQAVEIPQKLVPFEVYSLAFSQQ